MGKSRNMSSAFPAKPVTPKQFFEETIPALFEQLELDAGVRALDLELGVVLLSGGFDDSGDDAGDDAGENAAGVEGEWTLRLVEGELSVAAGRNEDCQITIVACIVDWRSALWEGRPALVAEAVASVFESARARRRLPVGLVGSGHAAAHKGLSEIRGLIEAVIEGDEMGSADWRVGVLIGPGPVPDSPQATVRLGAKQAEAIRRGELHPLEALITGQLRLEGDLGLILQLQAIAMLASMARPAAD